MVTSGRALHVPGSPAIVLPAETALWPSDNCINGIIMLASESDPDGFPDFSFSPVFIKKFRKDGFFIIFFSGKQQF